MNVTGSYTEDEPKLPRTLKPGVGRIIFFNEHLLVSLFSSFTTVNNTAERREEKKKIKG